MPALLVEIPPSPASLCLARVEGEGEESEVSFLNKDARSFKVTKTSSFSERGNNEVVFSSSSSPARERAMITTDDTDDDTTTNDDCIVCVQTYVNKSRIGLVIGVRGRTILEIEKRTDCAISVVRECQKQSEAKNRNHQQSEIVLTGKAKNCKEAAMMISMIADGFEDCDDNCEDGYYAQGKVHPLKNTFSGWSREEEEERGRVGVFSSQRQQQKEKSSDQDYDNDHDKEGGEDNDDRDDEFEMTTTPTREDEEKRKFSDERGRRRLLQQQHQNEKDAMQSIGALSALTLRIPVGKVALIIGKQGTHIEFLRHVSRCSLSMASEVAADIDVFNEHVIGPERILLIESASLLDCVKCAALVADIVEGSLFLQSNGPQSMAASDSSSLKEVHVSIREKASTLTKQLFDVTGEECVRKTITIYTAQKNPKSRMDRNHQKIKKRSSSQRRMSTSSPSPERHQHHQIYYGHHQQNDSYGYAESGYPPSVKFDPVSKALLAVVPSPVMMHGMMNMMNLNVNIDEDEGDGYVSEAYSTDSDFA